MQPRQDWTVTEVDLNAERNWTEAEDCLSVDMHVSHAGHGASEIILARWTASHWILRQRHDAAMIGCTQP